MARKPMVTRTFIGTRCEVLICELIQKTTDTIVVEVPGTYDKPEKLLKAVKASTETPELKVVSVLSTEEFTDLRGMSEQDFLNHSVSLDPETRKQIAAEEANLDPAPSENVVPQETEL